jgi:hypothetical protein
MPTTLPAIASQTTADTYEFTLESGATAQVYCTPTLGRREQITLNRSADDGGTWPIKVDTGKGGNVLCSEGTNSVMVSGPGYFQVAKPVTAVATAVFIDV